MIVASYALSIVMLVKDRPALTRQALTTLNRNTKSDWRLVIVDDESGEETRDTALYFRHALPRHVAVLRNENSTGVTAHARNLGVFWLERRFGRGDWLVLADNDACFLPNWDGRMQKAMTLAGLEVLGGQRHPYHLPNFEARVLDEMVLETDAVAGTSQMMSWKTWDVCGPLVETGVPGVGQSEDFVFCRKAIELRRGRVGYIHPPAILHCGRTNTDGRPAIGSEAMEMMAGVTYE